jgi:protein O-GlcNAc transferase
LDWQRLSRRAYSVAQYDEAIGILEEGISRTDDAVLRMERAQTFPKLAKSNDEIETAHAASARHLDILRAGKYQIGNLPKSIRRTPFHNAFHHLNGAPLQKAYADTFLSLDPKLSWISPNSSRPITRKIPRIGFLSMNYGQHVVGKGLNALLKRVDPADIDAIAIIPSAKKDFDLPFPYISVPLTLDAARQSIAELDLDLLVYADIGSDPFTYYLAFSRLARVQAAMPGNGLSTGIPAIDFFLTSSDWEGSLPIEDHYTEQPIRVETPTYFFEPLNHAPAPIDAVFDTRPLYLCTHSIYKYHPDFDRLIAGILRGDPKARLTMVCRDDTRWWDVLWDRWSDCIENLTDRVQIISRLERTRYLDLVSAADVILDSVHYSSGVTAFENLYLGTPTITLPSPYMRGRMTTGLCDILEVPELVASNESMYVDNAIRIANDKSLQADLKRRLLAGRNKIVANDETVKTFVACLRSLIERSIQH